MSGCVARNRHWNATWNNPPEDGFTTLKTIPGLKYLIAGKEVAPTTGTPHLQIFMTMKHPTTWRALKRKLTKAGAPSISFRPVTKTPHRAAAYCKKGTGGAQRAARAGGVDGDYQEWGDAPAQHGGPRGRTDLLALRDAVLQGKSRMDILTSEETAVAAARFTAYHRELEAQRQQAQEMQALKQELRGVVLRDWQNQAVLDLDEYSPSLLAMNVVST